MFSYLDNFNPSLTRQAETFIATQPYIQNQINCWMKFPSRTGSLSLFIKSTWSAGKYKTMRFFLFKIEDNKKVTIS